MKKPRPQKRKQKQKRQARPVAALSVGPHIDSTPLSVARQFFSGIAEPRRASAISRSAIASYSDDDRQALALLLLPVCLLAFAIGINQSLRDGFRGFGDIAHVEPDQPAKTRARTEVALARPSLLLPATPPAIVVPEPRANHTLARLPAEPPAAIGHDLIVAAPAMRLPPSAPAIERSEPIVASLLALPKLTPFIAPADPATAYACFPPIKSDARVLGHTPDLTTFGPKLAAAARAQLADFVIYDDRYRSIGYPMGDVPSIYGVCTDVVIRAYRALGYDLQVMVHEARVGNGDTSIDHRRTETLRRFFEKYGVSLPPSAEPADYLPGDIVTYYRPNNRRSRSHIVVVADEIGPSGRPMIIHNRGSGVQMEDTLFMDAITGHYRFVGLAPHEAAQIQSVPRRGAMLGASTSMTSLKLNAAFLAAPHASVSATSRLGRNAATQTSR